ncbi:protein DETOXIFICATION 55 [Euphorbia lathyris]|uniref:protein DETOXIFICATION 55 n=1 Tax=Euphorbia lathyris TaxID=212925 RepID=UPI0033140F1C
MDTTGKSPNYPTMPEVMEELKKITNIGFPILAMGLVTYLKNMILVVCMGRLGSLELAGGALAIGFTNITGYSVLSGLALGMEPICSQAFGSRNYSVASLTLQRTILMLLLASIPISLLWMNLEPLLLTLHQDREITKIASLYCRFSIPDLVANSLLHPIKIYLRSKGTTWPLMWCSLISILLHFLITIFLSFNLNLGVAGIAISSFVANFNTLVFLIIYIVYFTPEEDDKTHSVINTTSFYARKEWGILIKLSIPSCIGVCLEWWWYEFMTISSGYLSRPRVALATSAIVIQTTSLMYTLPTALSAAVSARVGNNLGATRPRKARLAAGIAIGLATLSSFTGVLLTTIGREKWARLFTEDEEVVKLSMIVLPIIGLCEVANCPQTTSCGILRGSARPSVGAGINFYSFYLVGAPVAIVLGFVWELGFVGLCYGLLGAQIACVVSILMVVYNTDWEREASKAKDLVGKCDALLLAHGDDHHHHQTVKCHQGGEVGFLVKDTSFIDSDKV